MKRSNSRNLYGTGCALLLALGLSACAPWYAKYGIPKGADLNAPENTAKLVEAMRTATGHDAFNVAEALAMADPTQTEPVLGPMLEALSLYCTYSEESPAARSARESREAREAREARETQATHEAAEAQIAEAANLINAGSQETDDARKAREARETRESRFSKKPRPTRQKQETVPAVAAAPTPASTSSTPAISAKDHNDYSCPLLARAARRHGAKAASEAARLNPYAAVYTLAELGPEGRDGLHAVVAALASPHAAIRQEAANALVKIAYPAPDVLAALQSTARDDADPQVREAASRSHRTLSAMALAGPLEERRPTTSPTKPAPNNNSNNGSSGATISGKQAPNDFAIVIGIETYRGTLPPSSAALADAKTFADIAETTLGVPRRNIILLTDDGATKSSLDSYLEDWLPKNVKPDSRVYFFFAGHGAPDPQTGKGYLVPWDGDPRFIERQGIGVDNIAERLQNLGVQQVVMMVDACFSGSGGRSVLAAGTRPLVPVQEFTVVPTPLQFAMIAAAGANEITGTTQDGNHGLFSHYLFEALRGQADLDQNNAITLNEIVHFVSNHVPDEARRDNREQTPRHHFSSESVGELTIVQIP